MSLFTYDNDMIIAHNFRDQAVDLHVTRSLSRTAIVDHQSGQRIATAERRVSPGWGQPPGPVNQVAGFSLTAHSFRVFRIV